MTDSASASAPPSSDHANPRDSGLQERSNSAAKGQRPSEAFRSHFGLMLALGKRYLSRHKMLVILSVATYLLGHSVLPAAVGLYAQKISNNIPVAQQEALSETANARESTRSNAAPQAAVGGRLPARTGDHSELWLAYGFWLRPPLAVPVMSLVFNYISTALGGRGSKPI